jgi:hypothetical protein
VVYFKIARIKEPLIPAVFMKLTAKNWQLHKRYLMGS